MISKMLRSLNLSSRFNSFNFGLALRATDRSSREKLESKVLTAEATGVPFVGAESRIGGIQSAELNLRGARSFVLVS